MPVPATTGISTLDFDPGFRPWISTLDLDPGRGMEGTIKRVAAWAGPVALAVALVIVASAADGDALRATWDAAVEHPAGMALALGACALAFLLRAWLWHRVLP